MLVIFGVTLLPSVAETYAALRVPVALRILSRGVPTFGVIVRVPNRPDFMVVGTSGCGRFRLATLLLCCARDVFFCRGFFCTVCDRGDAVVAEARLAYKFFLTSPFAL